MIHSYKMHEQDRIIEHENMRQKVIEKIKDTQSAYFDWTKNTFNKISSEYEELDFNFDYYNNQDEEENEATYLDDGYHYRREKVFEEIQQIHELITKLDLIVKMKGEVLNNIFSGLYKGIIAEVSFRKDGVYEYQQRGFINLQTFRKKVIANFGDFKDKLSTDKLEILEKCLEFIYEWEKMGRYDNYSNEAFLSEEILKKLSINLDKTDEIKVVEKETSSNNNKYDITTINQIEVNSSGVLNFKNETDDDIRINVRNALRIKQRFKERISEAFKTLLDFYERENARVDTEISQLKQIGGNILMLKELKKGEMN